MKRKFSSKGVRIESLLGYEKNQVLIELPKPQKN